MNKLIPILIAVAIVSVIGSAEALEYRNDIYKDALKNGEKTLTTDATKGADTQQYYDDYNKTIVCMNGNEYEIASKDLRDYTKYGAVVGECGTVPEEQLSFEFDQDEQVPIVNTRDKTDRISFWDSFFPEPIEEKIQTVPTNGKYVLESEYTQVLVELDFYQLQVEILEDENAELRQKISKQNRIITGLVLEIRDLDRYIQDLLS